MTMQLLTDILQESIPDLRNGRLHPVKVAIIDCGIDATHEVLRHKVIEAREYVELGDGDTSFVLENQLSCNANNDSSIQAPDTPSHGTAVASIISRIAPNARLLDYRTLGRQGASSSNKTVLAGLEAAIDGDAKIINISLVCDSNSRQELERLCELAYQKHKIIIASKRNGALQKGKNLGFPAELATCISVDNFNYNNNPFRIEHIDEQPIEFAAHGENVLVAQSGGGYSRISGTSFATPTVTGFVALLLGRYPDLELFEIKSILKYHSMNGTFRRPEIVNPLEVSEHRVPKGSNTSFKVMCPKCRHLTQGNDVFYYIKCPTCNQIFALFSDMDRKLFQVVIRVLSSNVPPDCLYHNVQHTREVVSNTYAFMQRHSELSAKQRKCLMAAALLHDYGYIESYTENEPIAAQYAADLLPQYCFDTQEIELVKSLILATTMPVAPKNLLEKILCDADVSHIGAEQHWEKANLLRKEQEKHGLLLTNKEWLKSEIGFLSRHRFYQKWLETERRDRKKQMVEKLSNMLKKEESCN